MKPIDPASFTVFRVAMGTLLAIEALRYLWNDWVTAHLTEPSFHFTYPGLSWVRPLPEPAMSGVVWLLVLAAVVLASGWMRRSSAVVLAVGWTYLSTIDQALYLNHHYLVVVLCLWMTCIPSTLPAWGLWGLRAQLLIVYTWAGISKLDGDWFAGMPLHMTFGPFLGEPWVSQGLAWTIIFAEVAAIPLFLWKRSRPVIMAFYVLFHLLTIPFYAIGIFPYLSLALLSLWAAPGWPRRWGATTWKEPQSPTSRRAAWVGATLLLVQAILPARTALAPGHPSWTMTHSRLTWRLLTAHKTGWVRFQMTSVQDGSTLEVSPLDYLTVWQASKMARNPWMIKDFAQWLAQEQVRRGYPEVEIRALNGVSLNGRPPVPSILSHVDLTQVSPNTAPFAWIAPLTEPLPAEPVQLDADWWILQMVGYDGLLAQAESAIAADDWTRVEALFRDGLILEPERDDLPALAITSQIDADRGEEALVWIQRWLDQAPDRQSAYVLRARIHYESGRLALAKPALEQAVALGKGAGPKMALARIAADQGQPDEARAWLEGACGDAPNNPEPALMLAELLTRHYRDHDEALRQLERIIRKAPSTALLRARDAVREAQRRDAGE